MKANARLASRFLIPIPLRCVSLPSGAYAGPYLASRHNSSSLSLGTTFRTILNFSLEQKCHIFRTEICDV
jgi:hypothetical protein